LIDGLDVRDDRQDRDGTDRPIFNRRLELLPRLDPACDLIPTNIDPNTRVGDWGATLPSLVDDVTVNPSENEAGRVVPNPSASCGAAGSLGETHTSAKVGSPGGDASPSMLITAGEPAETSTGDSFLDTASLPGNTGSTATLPQHRLCCEINCEKGPTTRDAISSTPNGARVKQPFRSRRKAWMPLDGSENALGELDTKGDGTLSLPERDFKNASH
jgi:hypothetical protein